MIKTVTSILIIFAIIPLLSGCGRDLSANTYTSDSTLNISLRGKLLAKRDIVIKENDKLGDNSTGSLVGAVGGAVAGGQINNSAPLIVGGAIVGGVTGAIVQSALGTSKGVEYIVEVDKTELQTDYYEGSRMLRNALAAIRATGIITIIQAKENKDNPVINEGQDVIIILSEKRTRIIPAFYKN
jgi:outer membrane lipoprotein SlyB